MEMSLNGNPAACRSDYQKTVVNKLPNLNFLDGMDNLDEKLRHETKISSNTYLNSEERDSYSSAYQVSPFQIERGLRVSACSRSLNNNGDLSSINRNCKGISQN